MTTYKPILGISNAKTSKGEDMGYLTGILYMAPSDMVKGINTCPFASEGCRRACLFSAGRGKFKNVEQARINKTIFFRDNRQSFWYSLIKDIEKTVRKAKRENLIPVIRLNGTSDISWENLKVKDDKNIFELFPEVQFYDYTKNPFRLLKDMPDNYHLTFSRSESNQAHVDMVLTGTNVNVAIVFNGDMPSEYLGRKVIDGDKHDLRFLDDKNCIVGLKAKGDAKKDNSGFVIKVA
jgi:hypothetical protein